MPSQEELDAEYSGSDLEAKVRRLESTVNGLMESGLDRLLASGMLQFNGIPMRWDSRGHQLDMSGSSVSARWFVPKLFPGIAPGRDVNDRLMYISEVGSIGDNGVNLAWNGWASNDPDNDDWAAVGLGINAQHNFGSGVISSVTFGSTVRDGGGTSKGGHAGFYAEWAEQFARFQIGNSESPTVLRLVDVGTAYTSPTDGDVWYESDKLYARINGATVELGASGGGMTTPALLAAPALDKTVNLPAPAAAAWTTANKAVYVPFELSDDRAVTEVIFGKGAVAGNVNVALYNEDAAGLPGARIGSALGSTAVSAGANAPQVLNITDQALSAGRYFVGIVFDTITTLTLTSWGGSAATTPLVGVYTEASAFTLPATATPVSPTGNLRIPALLVRTV